jgi:acyl carrier protein
MTNKQKYDKVFIDTFSIDENTLSSNPAYNKIQLWDSVGHMTMIAGVETTFNITIETDDIINFSSYEKGFEILAKYGIEF